MHGHMMALQIEGAIEDLVANLTNRFTSLFTTTPSTASAGGGRGGGDGGRGHFHQTIQAFLFLDDRRHRRPLRARRTPVLHHQPLMLLLLHMLLLLLLLSFFRGRRSFNGQHARRSDAVDVLPMTLQIIAIIEILEANITTEQRQGGHRRFFALFTTFSSSSSTTTSAFAAMHAQFVAAEIEAVLKGLFAQIAFVGFPEGEPVFRVEVVDVPFEIAVGLEILAASTAEVRHAPAFRRVMRMQQRRRGQVARRRRRLRRRSHLRDGRGSVVVVIVVDATTHGGSVDADGGR